MNETRSCRFGGFGQTIRPLVINFHQVVCVAPRASNEIYTYDIMNYTDTIYVSYGHGYVNTGLQFKYARRMDGEELYKFTLNEIYHQPTLNYVKPDRLGSNSNQMLQIVGTNFTNQVGTGCIFNKVEFVEARYISSNEIRCQVPRQIFPGLYSLFTINGGSMLQSRNTLNITVTAEASILSVIPSFGPSQGGTAILITGQFPWDLDKAGTVFCFIGSKRVVAMSFSSKVSFRSRFSYIMFLITKVSKMRC